MREIEAFERKFPKQKIPGKLSDDELIKKYLRALDSPEEDGDSSVEISDQQPKRGFPQNLETLEELSRETPGRDFIGVDIPRHPNASSSQNRQNHHDALDAHQNQPEQKIFYQPEIQQASKTDPAHLYQNRQWPPEDFTKNLAEDEPQQYQNHKSGKSNKNASKRQGEQPDFTNEAMNQRDTPYYINLDPEFGQYHTSEEEYQNLQIQHQQSYLYIHEKEQYTSDHGNEDGDIGGLLEYHQAYKDQLEYIKLNKKPTQESGTQNIENQQDQEISSMTQKYMTEEEISEYQKAKQMLEDFSKGYTFPNQPQTSEKLTAPKGNSRKKIARVPDPDKFDLLEEISKAKEMIDKFESKFGSLTTLGPKSG